MTQIITFTEDELVQMLEGGEVMMNSQAVMYGVGLAIAKGQKEIIFKKEENKNHDQHRQH
jgi:hypothetical protein